MIAVMSVTVLGAGDAGTDADTVPAANDRRWMMTYKISRHKPVASETDKDNTPQQPAVSVILQLLLLLMMMMMMTTTRQNLD